MRSCSAIPVSSRWGFPLPCGHSLGMEDRKSEPGQLSKRRRRTQAASSGPSFKHAVIHIRGQIPMDDRIEDIILVQGFMALGTKLRP